MTTIIEKNGIKITIESSDNHRNLAEEIRLLVGKNKEQKYDQKQISEFLMGVIYNLPVWPNDWDQDIAMAAYVIDSLQDKSKRNSQEWKTLVSMMHEGGLLPWIRKEEIELLTK